MGGVKSVMRNKLGFTLVEMIIVVALVAILAAAAIPMYTTNIKNARRSEGVAATLSVLNGAKNYYLDNNTFVGATLSNIDVDVGDALAHWNITLTPAATSIVITASGTGSGNYAGLSAILTYTIGNPNTTVIVDESGSVIFN